jgi:hypothetical protein
MPGDKWEPASVAAEALLWGHTARWWRERTPVQTSIQRAPLA